MMQKEELRDVFKQKRAKVVGELKQSADQAITKSLLSLSEYKEAKSVLFYLSLPVEVDTIAIVTDLLSEGKKVLVPFMLDNTINYTSISSFDDLTLSSYGVLEPVDKTPATKAVDVVLVPGLAFTDKGVRLGFGMANYDKFLAEKEVCKVALAYETQLTDTIPIEDHDVKMDIIITEKRVIRCG